MVPNDPAWSTPTGFITVHPDFILYERIDSLDCHGGAGFIRGTPNEITAQWSASGQRVAPGMTKNDSLSAQNGGWVLEVTKHGIKALSEYQNIY
jgi:hypothetical protein